MILTILFQTVAVVWWAASTEARVTHVEQALAKTENFGADMQTVQYRLNQIDIQADRIEDKIDRLSESKN